MCVNQTYLNAGPQNQSARAHAAEVDLSLTRLAAPGASKIIIIIIVIVIIVIMIIIMIIIILTETGCSRPRSGLHNKIPT